MKKQSYKLIEGKFTPQEAQEALSSIFSSKINFHQMRNFSFNERFGKDDAVSQKRIPELKTSMKEITEVVKEAKTNHQTLEITASVVIKLVDEKKTSSPRKKQVSDL